MQKICFSYVQSFSCLAGACPDTCCRDWEIDLDEAAKMRYRRIPGALGEELRAAMAEGGDCFRLKGACCPFLNEEGLCRIQLSFGEEALTVNCASFPRFCEIYGGTEELSLSPACPEAARLLLTAAAMELTTVQDARPPELNDLDPARVMGLRRIRKQAFGMLSAAESLQRKLGRLLALGAAAQKLVDTHQEERLISLEVPEEQNVSVDDNLIIQNYENLEILRPDWKEMLQRERQGAGDADCAERYAAYHLFRWLMKAAEDGEILSRFRSAVWGALCLEHLTAAGMDAVTALYRYCREIEHNEDNLMAVRSWRIP